MPQLFLTSRALQELLRCFFMSLKVWKLFWWWILHYILSVDFKRVEESTCTLIIKAHLRGGQGLLLTVEVSLRRGKHLAQMSKNTVLHTKCVQCELEMERWSVLRGKFSLWVFLNGVFLNLQPPNQASFSGFILEIEVISSKTSSCFQHVIWTTVQQIN